MEHFRWILLIAGAIFILVLYLLGRNHQRRKNLSQEAEEELPSFSATDWDALDEGVGEVRIIARHGDSETEDAYVSSPEPEPRIADQAVGATDARQDAHAAGAGNAPADTDAIIVLFIRARQGQLLGGDRINSVARANGLVFGDMNIFHRLDEQDRTLFSMANMVEPGSFDAESLHDLKTPGLTLFMQPSVLDDADAVLDELLITAYRMAETLDAVLCNRQRQPLGQQDAEALRQQVARV